MTGKNKTPLIGWHSADPTLKPWIESEARRRAITVRELLDKILEGARAAEDADDIADADAAMAEPGPSVPLEDTEAGK